MCANVNQMCDRMCNKGLTTDNTEMCLSQASTTEQETTKIYTICGYHLGVLHGLYHPSQLYIPGLCQWGHIGDRAIPVRPNAAR